MASKDECQVLDNGSKNNQEQTINRRESLKKIAQVSYAVPATMVLLTSTRAVAQSCPPECTDFEFTIHPDTDADVIANYFVCENVPQEVYPTQFQDNVYRGQCGTDVVVTTSVFGPISYTIEPPPATNYFLYPPPP